MVRIKDLEASPHLTRTAGVGYHCINRHRIQCLQIQDILSSSSRWSHIFIAHRARGEKVINACRSGGRPLGDLVEISILPCVGLPLVRGILEPSFHP